MLEVMREPKEPPSRTFVTASGMASGLVGFGTGSPSNNTDDRHTESFGSAPAPYFVEPTLQSRVAATHHSSSVAVPIPGIAGVPRRQPAAPLLADRIHSTHPYPRRFHPRPP